MKTTVATLQLLRQFREARAERALAAEQRALAKARQALVQAQEGVRDAQAQVAAADTALQQALLGGRLASGHYLEACEELQALRQAVTHAAGTRQAAQSAVAAGHQACDLAQRHFAQRHRQLEALQPWLAQEARQAQRARDSYEESLAEERRHPGGAPR